MRNPGIFLFPLIILFSCKPTPVKQSFSSADSLVIHFKDEQAGIVTRTVQTAEATALRKIIDFIDYRQTDQFNCGYDGKMFFYAKGRQLQEVDFNMKNDTCRHFAFLLNGKLTGTKMKNEAVDFLQALEKGMPYY